MHAEQTAEIFITTNNFDV